MATREQTPDQRSASEAGELGIQDALDRLMKIEGAIGATIVDYESGMTLGTEGGRTLDMQLAGAGNTEVIRSKKKIIRDLGLDEEIQDVLVSLENQYHLLRMCERHDDIFIYVVIERSQGNLGLARRKIDEIDNELELK
jgi:predicted regulator of Ras-like GTPase activity (Roadblock/LC7/MglB family)